MCEVVHVSDAIEQMVKDMDEGLAAAGGLDDAERVSDDEVISTDDEAEEDEGAKFDPSTPDSCIHTHEFVHDAERVCHDFGFALLPNSEIRRLTDDLLVGHLQLTFEGRTLYATCNRHARCSTMVQISGEYLKARAWLAKWLIAGANATAQAHLDAKADLRILIQKARPKAKAKAKSKGH